jgi:hypothetical protein
MKTQYPSRLSSFALFGSFVIVVLYFGCHKKHFPTSDNYHPEQRFNDSELVVWMKPGTNPADFIRDVRQFSGE